jgi:hypothetical protein
VEDAMTSVENSVPCILYLQKRIVEKVMHMLYIISIDKASKDNTSACLRHAKHIENEINTKAFGTVLDPGQYKFHINEKGEVAEVKFNDAWAEHMEAALPVLITLLIKETRNDPDEWLWYLTELSDIMDTLKQHEDFYQCKKKCSWSSN